MLSVNQLNQYYGESHTLWDLNMHAPKGQCTVLMGRNGVGKTTLLKCLMDMPQREGLWFTMNNAAITRIDFVDGYVDIVYQNRVDYLPAEIVS